MVLEHLVGDSAEPPNLIGRVFGDRYRVDELVGKGGMGCVYRALHVVMQQTVALKVMRRDLARDVTAIRRFYHEARACSGLKHHHTIKVHDFGVSDDGYPYLAMEYLSGRPLGAVLRAEGRLEAGRVVRLAQQVCKSLQEAHDAGIVHRDLKPANLFLAQVPGEGDYVKVLDFGVAKFLERDGGGEKSVTSTGMVVGTPRYMSPEQLCGRALDGRSDLYSLGVVLYELLSGQVPFGSLSTAELIARQMSEPAPPLSLAVGDDSVPPALCALVDGLLARDPADRPANAQALLDELDAIAVAGGGPRTTAPGPVGAPSTVPPVAGPRSPAPAGNSVPPAARSAAGPPRPRLRVGAAPTPAPVLATTAPGRGKAGARPRRWAMPPAQLLGIVLVAGLAVAVVVVGLMAFGGPAPDATGTGEPSPPPVGGGFGPAPATPDGSTALPQGRTVAAPGGPAAAPDVATGTETPPTVDGDRAAAAAPAPATGGRGPLGAGPGSPPSDLVCLTVQSEPPGAKVSVIRGQAMGVAPVRLEGPAGSRMQIRVSKRGFVPRTVELLFDTNRTEGVRLEPAPAARSGAPEPAVPQPTIIW